MSEKDLEAVFKLKEKGCAQWVMSIVDIVKALLAAGHLPALSWKSWMVPAEEWVFKFPSHAIRVPLSIIIFPSWTWSQCLIFQNQTLTLVALRAAEDLVPSLNLQKRKTLYFPTSVGWVNIMSADLHPTLNMTTPPFLACIYFFSKYWGQHFTLTPFPTLVLIFVSF